MSVTSHYVLKARPAMPTPRIPHITRTINGEQVECKSCARCCGVKPLTEYCKHAGTSDGLASYCLQCKRAMEREDVPRSVRQRRTAADVAMDNREMLARAGERVEEVWMPGDWRE